MAKELPYFRFTPQEWQNGDIFLESYHLKGLFIDICAYYWIKDCSITIAMLKRRYHDAEADIEKLVELGIIGYDIESDMVSIKFLNEQFDLLSDKRQKRVEAGRLGGLAKAKNQEKEQDCSNAKAMPKQSHSETEKCHSYKDKDNNKKDKYYNNDYSKDNNRKDLDTPIGVSSAPSQAQAKAPSKSIDCPQEKIIALYHEILPELPRVKSWSNTREKALRARWKESKQRQNLQWWQDFFQYISESDFLMGRTDTTFRPDLGWIVTASKFENILNGRYENKKTSKSTGIEEWLRWRKGQNQNEGVEI